MRDSLLTILDLISVKNPSSLNGNFLNKYNEDEILQAEILMKYEGYLEKEQLMVEKMNRLENVNINEDFDFTSIHNLSSEARQKLNKQNFIFDFGINFFKFSVEKIIFLYLKKINFTVNK